jgi:His/Glu/Gln/Arg/opine family amino acid ABC transporter permease subunit
MTIFTTPLLSHFLPAFLSGMSVDFEIAGLALALGLVFGSLLALARFRGEFVGAVASFVIGIMRAAPTFVVMFFLLNALPRAGLSGVMIVAVSLVPYAAAYVADSGLDALRHWHAGSHLACLLVLPNIARAFFVLVMSSSAGAAIGVPEGIAILLHEAQKLPSIGEMLVLFIIGIVCFSIPLQAGFAAVRLVQRHLGQRALRDRAPPLPESTPVQASSPPEWVGQQPHSSKVTIASQTPMGSFGR